MHFWIRCCNFNGLLISVRNRDARFECSHGAATTLRKVVTLVFIRFKSISLQLFQMIKSRWKFRGIFFRNIVAKSLKEVYVFTQWNFLWLWIYLLLLLFIFHVPKGNIVVAHDVSENHSVWLWLKNDNLKLSLLILSNSKCQCERASAHNCIWEWLIRNLRDAKMLIICFCKESKEWLTFLLWDSVTIYSNNVGTLFYDQASKAPFVNMFKALKVELLFMH